MTLHGQAPPYRVPSVPLVAWHCYASRAVRLVCVKGPAVAAIVSAVIEAPARHFGLAVTRRRCDATCHRITRACPFAQQYIGQGEARREEHKVIDKHMQAAGGRRVDWCAVIVSKAR